MKLIEAQVENFKCVEDSKAFRIDQVTCLIGKNEAGKTALLEALYKLNPVDKEKANFVEGEYPRRHLATNRQRRLGRELENVLTTTWELDDADVAFLEKLVGVGNVKKHPVTVTKGYGNKQCWTISGIDERAIVKSALVEAKLNVSERAPLEKAASVSMLVEIITGMDSPTPKHTSLLEDMQTRFPDGDVWAVIRKSLATRLPFFVYFDVYDQLPGRVALTDLKSRKEANDLKFSDKIFLALLDMTSTSLEEIEDISELEKLIMELESVEASLTDKIKEYWTQNKNLEVNFRYDLAKPGDPPPMDEGFIFSTRIKNTRHRATVNFDERSMGFIWFFSFLVWFSQVKAHYGDNLFLLLDEPGLSLHGKAQQDLLRYVNTELRPEYQVIYSAHSPFMIDVENIFSLRTVEDVVEVQKTEGESVERILGTKVGERILSRDNDTLFPLQGVVGFDITQTLFVGPYVVVVEGPTERVVFDWFSRQLSKRHREALDLRWAVCPAQGATKITSFVTLFAGRGLKVAVFSDYHKGQKKLMDELEESDLIEPDHLLKTSLYAGQDEADIEDVIGRDMYVHLVNGCLKLIGPHLLPTTKPSSAPGRVVKEVEAHCALLPPGFPEFSHYAPAAYLMGLSEGDVKDIPGLDQALDRFEAAFLALNSLI